MIIKNVLSLCFIDAHSIPKTFFLSCVCTPGFILGIYLPLASLNSSFIFIIIGTGAISIASMLPICTLLDQVGRLTKLIFQLAGVFKALFAWRSKEVRIFFFF